MSDLIVNDGPEDVCFGCGHRNAHGLRMSFRRIGEGAMEATYTVPEAYQGAAGVVHGGIQAALLDEVMGMSIHEIVGEARIVTADFRLRYRRPAPVATQLVIRGRVDRVEDPNYFLTAEILGPPDATLLTSAEARWRRLDPSPR